RQPVDEPSADGCRPGRPSPGHALPGHHGPDRAKPDLPRRGRLRPGADRTAHPRRPYSGAHLSAHPPLTRYVAAMSSATNSIEAEGLVREFKGGIRAVDGIDLHVAPGEIYGFLGPNGAGKSTTVLMLTTLLPPTAGRATVAGFDVGSQGPDVRR